MTMFPIFDSSQAAPCRVAATSNQAGTYINGPLANGQGATFTYTSNGALSIDGVTLNLNNRILFQNQTSAFQNGVWVVTATGDSASKATLIRSDDFQSIEQFKPGRFIPIIAGSSNAGFIFMLVEPAPLIIGTSSIVFNQV